VRYQDNLALKVAARYHREVTSTFIPDKWLSDKRKELVKLLKEPTSDRVTYWEAEFSKRFDTFLNNFLSAAEYGVSLREAQDFFKERVDQAREHLTSIEAKLMELGKAGDKWVDFSNPGSCLRWYAVLQIYEKIQGIAKTQGDLFKAYFYIDETVLDRLVAKTLRVATPKELETLTDENYNPAKYAFLLSVGFEAAALKALKKAKLDWKILDWFDTLVKDLRNEAASWKELDSFREFDLQGMKVIVEDSSVTAKDLKKYVQYLLQAKALLKAKGFERAWYGNVFIQCRECGGVNYNTGENDVGGHYVIPKDTISIFSRPSSWISKLVIHELGHRYWFKSMTSAQREKYKSLVKVHKVPKPIGLSDSRLIDVKGVKAIKGIIAQVEEEFLGKIKNIVLTRRTLSILEDLTEEVFRKVQAFSLSIDQNLGSEVSDLKEAAKKSVQDFYDRGKELLVEEEVGWRETLKTLFEELVSNAFIYLDFAFLEHNKKIQEQSGPDILTKFWQDSYDNNPNPVVPVSDYGKSNIDEAFAEAFMHYVVEDDMTRDQLESFKAVLKTARVLLPDPV
jgi:hypothetical protein